MPNVKCIDCSDSWDSVDEFREDASEMIDEIEDGELAEETLRQIEASVNFVIQSEDSDFFTMACCPDCWKDREAAGQVGA